MNKKGKKSILLILVALVLAVCMFGGCSKKDEGTKATATKSPASATPGATATPAAPATATAAATPTAGKLSDPPKDYNKDEKAPAADIIDVVFENGEAKDKSAAKRELTAINDPEISTDSSINKTVATFEGLGESVGGGSMFASYNFQDAYDALGKACTFEIYASISDIEMYNTIFANLQAGGMGIDFDPNNSATPFNEGGHASIGFGVYDSGRASVEGFTDAGYIFLYADEDIEQDRYYHIVGTYDGTTVKLYYDGVMIKEAKLGGAIKFPASSQYLGIGGDAGETDQGESMMNGSLAIARIYSKALTDSQVYNLYLDAVQK